MRIHTDTITYRDLHRLLPTGVYLEATQHGSRKRTRAFEVKLYLYDLDDLHRRRRNFNRADDLGEVAATWDEWGVWMERLYDLDPSAIIGWYEDHDDFIQKTKDERERVRAFAKPESLEYRTHLAPWLDRHLIDTLYGPPAR